jgi:hypothetical protein
MGRILTTLLCFWLGLSPLLGQRLLVRQPIEGFRGSGEVLAYSSSRIFLQLNKDGEWPRQIEWVILDGSEPRCAITFNKVGWQYTSSTDSCSLDWIRLDPTTYRYRLFVVESIPSPSETLPDRVAESLLLTRTPSSPPPAPVAAKPQAEEIERTQAQDNAKSTSKPSNIDSTTEDSIRSVTAAVPLTPNPPNGQDTLKFKPVAITPAIVGTKQSSELAENSPSKDQDPLDDLSTHTSPPSDLATTTTNTMEAALENSVMDAPKLSQIATPLPPAEPSPTDLVDTLSLNPESTTFQETMEETPDYIFTVPDYQPRRRWFGRKKKAPTPEASNTLVSPTPKVAERVNETESTGKNAVPDAGKPTIPSGPPVVANKIENDTSVYEQKAPFISVASFETLEYTQEVLDQFTCPKGCIIVRSEKGLYYRIGFYPDPKNIAVDLREIRKKYSDAWLVN